MIETITAPILLLLPTLCAALLGRQLLSRLRLADPQTPGRLLFDLGAGLAVLSLLLGALGLLGLLKLPIAIGLLLVFALAGASQAHSLWADLQRGLSRLGRTLGGPDGSFRLKGALLCFGALLLSIALAASGDSGLPLMAAAGACLLSLAGLTIWRPGLGIAWLLVLWCVAGSLAAIAPPTDNDWDGLAEHLAQAKIYAATGRFQPLWYDHHSHFPSAPQMLFSLGMLLQGVSLAKLFHWLHGMLCMAAAFSIAERFVARGSGKWAALAVAGTPLVGWLMQVGYVDLTTCAYALLMTLSLLDWLKRRDARLLALSGVIAGAMMATKMQGIALFGVVGVAVLWVVLRRREGFGAAARAACVFGLAAAVLSAPWYIKTWVLTGNPVYPFAYSVFGGKYWGPAEAESYDYHQKEFGVGPIAPAEEFYNQPRLQRLFSGPRSPLSLLLAPWNLTFNPVPFTVQWRRGAEALLPVLLTDWIGPLYLIALLVLLGLWLRKRARPFPPALSLLLWLFLPLWIWWLASMQLTRYLIPSLLLLAPVVGYVAWRAPSPLLRAPSALWLGVCVAGALYLAGAPALVATGIIPQDAYLRMACQVYEPSMVLNRIVPADGKVGTYGEPRGYYMDCEYMWADPGHHRIIPYDQVSTPDQLLAELRKIGLTHVLINQTHTGAFSPEQGAPLGLLAQAVADGDVSVVRDDELKRPEYVILDIRERR